MKLADFEILGMKFHEPIGCFPQEKETGVDLSVDFRYSLDISKSAKTDDLNDTLDVNEIYRVIENEVKKPANLLENLIERIVDAIVKNFPQLHSFEVRIKKLNPPFKGQVDSWSITRKETLKRID